MKQLLSLSLFVLIFSCSSEKPTTEFEVRTIEQEIKTMFMAYDDSVRKNGINGEFFFLDKSDAFYWVPPGYKYALHYDSIANILAAYAPLYTHIDNNWDTLQIIPLSDKYASFNGVINSFMVSSKNDTSITKLSETGLVVKRGKHWKLLSGQTVIISNE